VNPINVRNSNPLNVRPGQPYEGLGTPSQQGGFCNFSTPVWGFRAVFRNFITKHDRGVRSVRALVSEWAPPTDNNDTEAYIASVCKSADLKPDDVIELKSWPVASAVCYAMTQVETGAPFETYWKAADMAEGAYRAGIVDAPKSPIRRVGVVVAGSASAISATAPQIIDTINVYRPTIDATNSATLKTIFGAAAAVFALIAIINHVRASK
jgi:hypothetical protein